MAQNLLCTSNITLIQWDLSRTSVGRSFTAQMLSFTRYVREGTFQSIKHNLVQLNHCGLIYCHHFVISIPWTLNDKIQNFKRKCHIDCLCYLLGKCIRVFHASFHHRESGTHNPRALAPCRLGQENCSWSVEQPLFLQTISGAGRPLTASCFTYHPCKALSKKRRA